MCWIIYQIKDGYNQTYIVRYSTNIETFWFHHLISEDIMFYCLNSGDSKHYVIDKLIYYSWVLLPIVSDLSRQTVLDNI